MARYRESMDVGGTFTGVVFYGEVAGAYDAVFASLDLTRPGAWRSLNSEKGTGD